MKKWQRELDMTGKVKIHGKEYKTVALRVAEFRAAHPDYTIQTELIEANDVLVIMKATISNCGVVIATGYAEEVRAASKINSTSALENAESSAVGRALAFFGLGGTEIASADEVANAIQQQNDTGPAVLTEWAMYMELVRKHWNSLEAVRQGIATGNLSTAKEAWTELCADDEEDAKALWRATTKGGVFTTEERKTIKSDEWNAA